MTNNCCWLSPTIDSKNSHFFSSAILKLSLNVFTEEVSKCKTYNYYACANFRAHLVVLPNLFVYLLS